MTGRIKMALLGSTLLAGAASAQDVTLTIESWRNDDLQIWQDTIIPAFEAANPGIKVQFAPTTPAAEHRVHATMFAPRASSPSLASGAGAVATCAVAVEIEVNTPAPQAEPTTTTRNVQAHRPRRSINLFLTEWTD